METGKPDRAKSAVGEKLPISVCILVKDEIDLLPRVLPPLREFAEVLVLDSGSTDGSLEFCRTSGCRVEEGPWQGFGATRCRLFEMAQQPWLFWLDADEIVTPGLLAELRLLFDRSPGCDAYRVNRMIQFEGRWIRHGDWFPDWNVRLFRSDCWDMEAREVHESLRVHGEIGTLHGLLEHHSFRDREDLRRRGERYGRLWVKQERRRGRTSYLGEGILRAFWRLIRGYILKRGFLDGEQGWHIAAANARAVRWKYTLMRRSDRTHRRRDRLLSPLAPSPE